VIIGDVYPPSTFAVWIAEVSGTLWTLGIVLVIFGKSIFDITGLPVPFSSTTSVITRFRLSSSYSSLITSDTLSSSSVNYRQVGYNR